MDNSNPRVVTVLVDPDHISLVHILDWLKKKKNKITKHSGVRITNFDRSSTDFINFFRFTINLKTKKNREKRVWACVCFFFFENDFESTTEIAGHKTRIFFIDRKRFSPPPHRI